VLKTIKEMGLTTLSMRRCKLKEIPREIGELKSLEQIDMLGNSIKEIPEELFKLDKLKELDFRYNKISKISNKIKNLKKLEILYLENNNIIKELPIEVKDLYIKGTLFMDKKSLIFVLSDWYDKKAIKWSVLNILLTYIDKIPNWFSKKYKEELEWRDLGMFD
jgi:hypothetical protein